MPPDPYPSTFTDKLLASMNEAAAYWSNPAVPATDQQMWLAKQYAQGGTVMNQYLTILFQREGFTDATPYADYTARLAALETSLIKLWCPIV